VQDFSPSHSVGCYSKLGSSCWARSWVMKTSRELRRGPGWGQGRALEECTGQPRPRCWSRGWAAPGLAWCGVLRGRVCVALLLSSTLRWEQTRRQEKPLPRPSTLPRAARRAGGPVLPPQSGSRLRGSCRGWALPPRQPLLAVNCCLRDLFEVCAPICNADPPSACLPPRNESPRR